MDRKLYRAFVFFISSVLLMPALHAQEINPLQEGNQSQQLQSTQRGQGAGQKSQKIDEETLKAFAKAAEAIFNIRKEYIPKLQALRQEASKKMDEAIRKHGMEVQEYKDVGAKIKSDPALQEKVKQYSSMVGGSSDK